MGKVGAVGGEMKYLPGSEREPSVLDWDVERDAEHGGLDVSGHVVIALVRVLKAPIVIPARWHQLVERNLHVATNGRVGILIDCDAT